jgi:hypothetical protein
MSLPGGEVLCREMQVRGLEVNSGVWKAILIGQKGAQAANHWTHTSATRTIQLSPNPAL